MARFTIKALVITALVCLVIDWSCAEEAQQHEHYGGKNLEKVKDKGIEFVNSVKHTVSDTYEKMKDSEKTKIVGSKLSEFFSNAMESLKNKFSPKQHYKESTKEEAIKAFDDYAQEHAKAAQRKKK